MTTNVTRVSRFVIIAGVLAMQSLPVFAQFTGAGTQATNWVVQLLTPLLPLACCVVGALCFLGRINWYWLAGALTGTCLFFGRDQVVTMMRGWFGV